MPRPQAVQPRLVAPAMYQVAAMPAGSHDICGTVSAIPKVEAMQELDNSLALLQKEVLESIARDLEIENAWAITLYSQRGAGPCSWSVWPSSRERSWRLLPETLRLFNAAGKQVGRHVTLAIPAGLHDGQMHVSLRSTSCWTSQQRSTR